ncbi:MAG TPA: trehalose-phosphatase [Terriglobia bacterium]|nr:trehalose-phosphatase [Terriglobia bacterium]
MTAAKAGVPHVFDRLPQIDRRLRRARKVALFLDFDGTLTPLRRRPGEVQLDPAMRRAIARLVRHPGVKVWVISGRRLADVRRRVGVKGVTCLGLHGWEARPRQPLPAASRRIIRRSCDLIKASLAGFPGLWVEDKGAVFVVHYREGRPVDVRRGRRVVQRMMKGFAPPLRLLAGKKIWEVFPREVKGKGEAARAIAARLPAGTLVVYAGDDATDEDAFRALPGALTVRVGRSAPTGAKYRLADPTEVREFLERMEGVLP